MFLVKEGLVDVSKTLRLASLSVEPAGPESSLVVAAFDVTLDDEQRKQFVQREPEYDIATTSFYGLVPDSENQVTAEVAPTAGQGVICLASKSDADLTMLDIPASLKEHPNGVWHWPRDSGLLPADIYLRHCLLAVQKAGGPAYQSFLHDTYLADRVMTLAEYLEQHGEQVMASRPPPHLATRLHDVYTYLKPGGCKGETFKRTCSARKSHLIAYSHDTKSEKWPSTMAL
eukprot:scaffold35381_cov260-Amphora_coffeaeformis.AAC.2